VCAKGCGFRDGGCEEKRERERERGGEEREKGGRETQRTKQRGVEVHGEQRGIEDERRNTWFYLQKQSLRGTNTGRH